MQIAGKLVAFLLIASGTPFTSARQDGRDDYDQKIEQQLLVLANQSRKQVGAPPLKMDDGLVQAARIHARAMRRAGELSHQFRGEPALPERLAAETQLQLEEEGENVALDYDADGAHRRLMHSPPHRANLLNSSFNVVGMGVIHGGEHIYVVQDFGCALPSYSATEVKEKVATALNQVRARSRRPVLHNRNWLGADDAACSMAKADKLRTDSVKGLSESYSVLTYTSLHPEKLPEGASRAVAGRNLRSFSIGACYARTATYPTGVYWIVLVLE